MLPVGRHRHVIGPLAGDAKAPYDPARCQIDANDVREARPRDDQESAVLRGEHVIHELVVPFADLLLAVIRRTRAGRSPFSPDKQHLHHRLLEIGHSHRRAVLIMYLWAGLIAFGGVLASLYAGAFTTYLLVVWVLVTVALTFVVPRLQRPSTRV